MTAVGHVRGGTRAISVYEARSSRLMAGTVLAGSLALSIIAVGFASAADGDGGNGGGTGFGTGGTGATGFTGITGGQGNGGNADTFGGGGGGGGGGAGGGMGGTGGNSGDGAPGGTGGLAGLPGNPGTGGCDCDFISGGGGGGGGGGNNAITAASINNTTLLTGAAGGAGGTGGAGAFGGNGGGGGGGGAGGYGAVVTGAIVNTNTNAITGGNGGNGGNGGAGGGSFEGPGGTGGNGGNGGTGGTGVAVTTAGASLTNSGTIRGGDGGAGGAGGNGAPPGGTGGTGGNGGAGGAGGAGVTASGLRLTNSGLIVGGNGGIGGAAGAGNVNGTVGAGGLGGVGVSGGNVTIINTGTISGGFGSGGQAYSLDFTSGSNFLNNQGGILNGGINVATSATLTFNQSATVILSNVISGGGAVIQGGAGTLVLTGTNTYTGGTTISTGTLQLGNGGTTGTIDGTAGVINNSNLAFDHSNAFTFANNITGTGAVQQIGTGTTILTGNSTYTGATTVAAGGLTINGSLGTADSHTSLLTNSGTVTVNGTLWATDVTNNVGGLVVNNGTVNGALSNSGTVTNSGSYNAAVNSTGSQALITNSAAGIWTGSLVSNTGGATVKNLGTWTGDASNASVVVNSGIWNTASAGFANSGTLSTTGTLNATAGGLTNTGTVNAQGAISGGIANIGPGTFTVTGPLSGSGGNFSNGSGAILTVGANTFNNIGTLTNNMGGTVNIAGGTIGAVTTANSGTINATGTSTINGTLSNSGTISLLNNFAGDRLTVTGNFVGLPGSRISLDFNPQTARADQVVIGGSATGSTALFVNNLAPGTLFTTSPNLIVAQGPTSPNAFTLGNPQNFGTFEVALLPTASGAGLNFALGTIPSSAGLSGSVAVTAAQTLGFVTNDVAFDRMSELRDSLRRNSSQSAGAPATAYAQELAKNDPLSPYVKAEAAPSSSSGPNPAAWVRGFGDYEQRDGQANFGFGGSTFASNLGFHQGTGGVLGGVDWVWNGLTRANDGLILGLLGGYTNSRVDLRDSSTSQMFSGESVGVYGTYLTGNWFFDLLLKLDLLSLDISIPGMSQSASLNNYNAATNIGYKFDFQNNFYIEPTAGLEYIRTNFDQTTSLTATTVALNDGNALRARAGARIGTEWVVNNIRVEPSILATAWEIPAATNSALFTNGVGISLPSDVGRVRGEVQAAVNFFNLQTGLSGFARFDTRFGESLFSLGGLAGLRYQW